MSTEQNVTVDPRCIKCGKRQSDHNWFGEFGYLCRNGSNTFEAEASSRLQQPIGGTEAQRLRAALSNIKELAEAADYLTGVPDFGVIVGYASAALSPAPIEAGEVDGQAWIVDEIRLSIIRQVSADLVGAAEHHVRLSTTDWDIVLRHLKPTPSASSEVSDKVRILLSGLWASTTDEARKNYAAQYGSILALLPPTGNSRGESGK